MPTGYTYLIEKGISFNDFVLQCARAFGALITMRDEPANAVIPDEFKPSDYNKVELQKSREELESIKQITVNEADIMAEKEYKRDLDNFQKRISDKRELKRKYQDMLNSVLKWVPPTSDHEGLRSFMIEQIKGSIDFDCSEKDDDPPKLKSGREWLEEKINSCLRDISYHEKAWKEEVDRCRERTDWVKKLKDSLQ